MKKEKASKPSEMGLHKTVRFYVKPIGKNLTEQEDFIVYFTMQLYQYMQQLTDREHATDIFTKRFARFTSKALLFEGFTDDEVFVILKKAADRNRKKIAK